MTALVNEVHRLAGVFGSDAGRIQRALDVILPGLGTYDPRIVPPVAPPPLARPPVPVIPGLGRPLLLKGLEALSLAPQNSGAYERVLSALAYLRFNDGLIDIQAIKNLLDPWLCNEAELPLLAWSRSVDIWDDTWQIGRKRQVVAESRVFHSLKTTIAGDRMALGYMDSQLVDYTIPRHGFFVEKSQSKDRYEAWLSSLPEIRIYAPRPRTTAHRRGFFVGRTPIGSAQRVVTDSCRAEMITPGGILPLILSPPGINAAGQVETLPERLLVPAPVPDIIKRHPRGRVVLSKKSTATHILTPRFADGALETIGTGLTPTSVTPKTVYRHEAGNGGIVVGKGIRNRFVQARGRSPIDYWSFRLVHLGPDTSNIRPAGFIGNRIGKSRISTERYRKHLVVHAPRPRPALSWASGRWVRASPEMRLKKIEQVLSGVQAARDSVFVSYSSVRPLTYADLEAMQTPARYGYSILR